jgi:hypothetical protein
MIVVSGFFVVSDGLAVALFFVSDGFSGGLLIGVKSRAGIDIQQQPLYVTLGTSLSIVTPTSSRPNEIEKAGSGVGGVPYQREIAQMPV